MNWDYRLNENILRIIKEKSMRPGEIADRANIKRPIFSNILHGKRKIYGDELFRIAIAMETDIVELTEGVIDWTPES